MTVSRGAEFAGVKFGNGEYRFEVRVQIPEKESRSFVGGEYRFREKTAGVS
jgi:hypothetical protein